MLPELQILGLAIDSYSLLYALAALVSGILLAWELRRRGHAPGLAAVIIVVALAGGFVGGKLYYVFQAPSEADLASLDTYLGITGTAWYGAFILGTVAVLLTLRLAGLPILAILDLLAPIVPLAQAIGRLGCLLAGCCRGTPADVPWAVVYPGGWPRQAHPAPLYEASLYLLIAAFLWSLRKSRTIRPGGRFGLYLVLAGLGRFFVEFYRLNREVALSLTAPQLAAVLGIIVGVVLISRRGEDDCEGADSSGPGRSGSRRPRD